MTDKGAVKNEEMTQIPLRLTVISTVGVEKSHSTIVQASLGGGDFSTSLEMTQRQAAGCHLLNFRENECVQKGL